MTWEVLGKTPAGLKLFVLSAVEKTLAAIERVFTAAGIEVLPITDFGFFRFYQLS